MAIQVGGTTVIDNSRNLQNVQGIKTIGGSSILGSGDIAVGGVDSGTTAQRPSSPSEGDLYFNTDLETLEVYRYVTSPGGYVTRATGGSSDVLYRSSLSHTPNSGANTDAAYGFEFEGGEGARSTNGNEWRLTYVNTVGYSQPTYYYSGGTQTTITLPANGSFVGIGQSVAFTFSGVREYTLEENVASSSALAWCAVSNFGEPTTGTSYKIANIQSSSSIVAYNSNYNTVGDSVTSGSGNGYARTGFALGAGEITVSGGLRTRNSSYTASVRLMKNGSQVGEQSTTSTSEVTKTFTTTINPGDSLDIQFKTSQYGQDYDIYKWYIYSGTSAFGSVILT